MRTSLVGVLLSLTLGPAASSGRAASLPRDESVAAYDVEISVADDVFRVGYEPGPLEDEQDVLRFVGYAPGVHSRLDFGRFVRGLAVLDRAGGELEVERLDVNTWRIAAPSRVARIEYEIEDTFDTEIEEHQVLPCAGTGIQDDYVLLNPFGVLAYFDGLLDRATSLRVRLAPEGADRSHWTFGTALEADDEGAYRAESYRHLVDQPLLLGELSVAETWVGDIEVEIYVRSQTADVNAEGILFSVGEVLEAAERFLGFAPVERYVFLMVFFDFQRLRSNRFRAFGALEHNTSSVYTLPLFGPVMDGLPRTIAHEFMHVLSPLHLRSDVIANFDFSVPTTDGHLWLYEGLTEWTAGILRLRGEVVDLEGYLSEMSLKIQSAAQYDEEYSLERLSYEWSTDEGGRQYGNIYQQGALTAMALDVLLLELSAGERGLREVYVELIERFGKDRPFDPETFVDVLVDATYPEVERFFDAYVRDGDPLPYDELLAPIGIRLARDGGRSLLVPGEDATPEQLALRGRWMRNLGS